MTAKVIPLIDQRTTNRVQVIPAHPFSPSGALAVAAGMGQCQRGLGA